MGFHGVGVVNRREAFGQAEKLLWQRVAPSADAVENGYCIKEKSSYAALSHAVGDCQLDWPMPG